MASNAKRKSRSIFHFLRNMAKFSKCLMSRAPVAFMMFSNYKRAPEIWPLSKNLYDVVKKATSDKKVYRQQSIAQFINEWNAAKEFE